MSCMQTDADAGRPIHGCRACIHACMRLCRAHAHIHLGSGDGRDRDRLLLSSRRCLSLSLVARKLRPLSCRRHMLGSRCSQWLASGRHGGRHGLGRGAGLAGRALVASSNLRLERSQLVIDVLCVWRTPALFWLRCTLLRC